MYIYIFPLILSVIFNQCSIDELYYREYYIEKSNKWLTFIEFSGGEKLTSELGARRTKSSCFRKKTVALSASFGLFYLFSLVYQHINIDEHFTYRIFFVLPEKNFDSIEKLLKNTTSAKYFRFVNSNLYLYSLCMYIIHHIQYVLILI